MVIAGLNRDYVAVLVLLDEQAAAALLGAPPRALSTAQLSREPRLLRALAERLERHARSQLGSTTRVCRAAVLAEPPSLDRGEITDKGSLNQRLLLERRAAALDELYREIPPPHVICVQPEQGLI